MPRLTVLVVLAAIGAGSAAAEYDYSKRLWLEAATCYQITHEFRWHEYAQQVMGDMRKLDAEAGGTRVEEANGQFQLEIASYSTLALMQVNELCDRRAAELWPADR